MKGSPVISQQSDYTVLQIAQEAIQNCDTSEYVTLLHGITGSLQSFEAACMYYQYNMCPCYMVLQAPYNRLKQHSRGMYYQFQVMIMTRESCTRYLRWSAS